LRVKPDARLAVTWSSTTTADRTRRWTTGRQQRSTLHHPAHWRPSVMVLAEGGQSSLTDPDFLSRQWGPPQRGSTLIGSLRKGQELCPLLLIELAHGTVLPGPLTPPVGLAGLEERSVQLFEPLRFR